MENLVRDPDTLELINPEELEQRKLAKQQAYQQYIAQQDPNIQQLAQSYRNNPTGSPDIINNNANIDQELPGAQAFQESLKKSTGLPRLRQMIGK